MCPRILSKRRGGVRSLCSDAQACSAEATAHRERAMIIVIIITIIIMIVTIITMMMMIMIIMIVVRRSRRRGGLCGGIPRSFGGLL